MRNTKPHILVVEDEPAIVDMLTMLLELEGYQVSSADNALAAIDLLADTAYEAQDRTVRVTQRPDLILLDLQLPAMDGQDMIRYLEDTAQVIPPVIVLSAKRKEMAEAEARAINAAAVLVKPFDVPTLLTNIAQVLAKHA